MIWFPLVALLVSQDPTPLLPPEWRKLDSAALIVNEDVITDVDVIAEMRRTQPAPRSDEERAKLQERIVTEKVRSLLETQAGKVMGYDEKMVERFVQDRLEDQREAAGSVTNLANQLRAANMDSFQHKEEIRTFAYGSLWQRSQTGIDAAPKGRRAADRYVRPGRLYFEFKNQEAQIAADPLVTVHTFGVRIGNRAPEEVRASFEGLRKLALESGDFDGEVLKFSAGQMQAEPLADRSLSSFRFVREIWEFLRTSEPGAVSDVLEIRTNGTLDGYRLVYFAERKARPTPEFSDPELQKKLREGVETSLDNVRVQTALEKLYHAAYIWPPEMLGRRTTLEN
jgi:hypothetical protein